MTRAELRIFLDGFYCGCGAPEAASASFLRLLEQYNDEERDTREPAYKALPKWIPDDGLMFLTLYWLTHLDLLEHGGGVLASWLTDKGREVLGAMREEKADGFEALHGQYCVHGVDVDDIGPGKHDCSKADADDRSKE